MAVTAWLSATFMLSPAIAGSMSQPYLTQQQIEFMKQREAQAGQRPLTVPEVRAIGLRQGLLVPRTTPEQLKFLGDREKTYPPETAEQTHAREWAEQSRTLQSRQ